LIVAPKTEIGNKHSRIMWQVDCSDPSKHDRPEAVNLLWAESICMYRDILSGRKTKLLETVSIGRSYQRGLIGGND